MRLDHTMGPKRQMRRGVFAIAAMRAIGLLTALSVSGAEVTPPGSASGDSTASIELLDSPLTLTAAKRIALRDNPGIEAAASRVRAAFAALKQAQSLYYPTVSLAAQAEHTETLPASQQGLGLDSFRTYTVAGNISWLLFDGAARRSNVSAAHYGEDAAREAYHDAQRRLLQSVAVAFFNSLLARENITIARQDAEFNEELNEETKKRFEAGAAAKSDVLNFEIRTTEAESRYVAAEHDFRTAKTVLAELLGIPQAALPEDAALRSPGQPPTPTAIPEFDSEREYALAHRPDLIQLEQSARQLRAQLRAAKAEYLPKVVLEGTYGENRLSNARFNDDTDAMAYVGIAASWDLFSGGSTAYACREMRARLDAVEEQLAQSRIALVSQLRRQIDAARVTRTQMSLQEQIAQMTGEVRELVRNEYLAGRTSLTRLNEAQTDLVRASAQLAFSRIRHWQALEDVAAASGRNLALAE